MKNDASQKSVVDLLSMNIYEHSGRGLFRTVLEVLLGNMMRVAQTYVAEDPL